MIYEYLCSSCGHTTEEMKKVDDRINCPPCAKCGKETLLSISLCNFDLRGSFPGQDYKVERLNQKYLEEKKTKVKQ